MTVILDVLKPVSTLLKCSKVELICVRAINFMLLSVLNLALLSARWERTPDGVHAKVVLCAVLRFLFNSKGGRQAGMEADGICQTLQQGSGAKNVQVAELQCITKFKIVCYHNAFFLVSVRIVIR